MGPRQQPGPVVDAARSLPPPPKSWAGALHLTFPHRKAGMGRTSSSDAQLDHSGKDVCAGGVRVSRNWVPTGSRVCHGSSHGDGWLAPSPPACCCPPPPPRGQAGEGGLLFFQFMVLIASNYKGPQGGLGRKERTWERQRFPASTHHPHLPPTPPQVHVEKGPRPF